MARTSLAALLPSDADATASRATERQMTRPKRPVQEVPATPRRTEPSTTGPAEPGVGPRYLQMERKEARLRLDQADALAQLTRRLNRARRGTGERITDNTLLRVAIDLLLARSDQLVGLTEDELRESLTL